MGTHLRGSACPFAWACASESSPWKDRLSRRRFLREPRSAIFMLEAPRIHRRPSYRSRAAESPQESVRNGFQLWEKQHLYDGLMRLLSDVKIVNTRRRKIACNLTSPRPSPAERVTRYARGVFFSLVGSSSERATRGRSSRSRCSGLVSAGGASEERIILFVIHSRRSYKNTDSSLHARRVSRCS